MPHFCIPLFSEEYHQHFSSCRCELKQRHKIMCHIHVSKNLAYVSTQYACQNLQGKSTESCSHKFVSFPYMRHKKLRLPKSQIRYKSNQISIRWPKNIFLPPNCIQNAAYLVHLVLEWADRVQSQQEVMPVPAACPWASDFDSDFAQLLSAHHTLLRPLLA